MKTFVESLVKYCVHEPDAVSVSVGADRSGTVYTITVAPEDVGRIIGKDGRVISCIRQVVGAVGAKTRERAFVKVQTDD